MIKLDITQTWSHMTSVRSEIILTDRPAAGIEDMRVSFIASFIVSFIASPFLMHALVLTPPGTQLYQNDTTAFDKGP